MSLVNAGCIGYLLALFVQALCEKRYGFAAVATAAIGLNAVALVIST